MKLVYKILKVLNEKFGLEGIKSVMLKESKTENFAQTLI